MVLWEEMRKGYCQQQPPGSKVQETDSSPNLCWDRRLISERLESGLQEGGREGLDHKVALVLQGPM